MAKARIKKAYPDRSEDHAHLVKVFSEYKREAHDARRWRLKKNRRNWDLYNGNQDWSHKIEGQSTEFIPKLALAAEQMSAAIRKALTQFGPWFSLQLPAGAIISNEQARTLLMRFLQQLVVGRHKKVGIATVLADVVKQGLMESILVLKIHGYPVTEKTFQVEPGHLIAGIPEKLNSREDKVWRLRIDCVPSEDYMQDPTGRGLYEIHTVERDLVDVLDMADAGVYDKKIVDGIQEDFARDRSLLLQPRHKNQNVAVPPSFRKRMVIDEIWGTILGPDGLPLATNVVAAMANDKYIIREPEDNPFWHQESPFVATPIIRIPGSTLGKAFYDHVADLNVALNELFNLILDGGMASVWGVRQVRPNYLEDERQIAGGISQGTTLVLNENAPADGKAIEVVASGTVPPEALAVYNLTDRELDASAMTNSFKIGSLPQRQVKATEVVEVQQNQAVMLENFTAEIEENIIEPMLRKAWLCVMQFADDIPAQDVVDAVGVNTAFKLSQMSPASRYAMFARASFSAFGLSGTLAKARDFQKIMALMQGIRANPVLMEVFVRTTSADKTLKTLMRSLNIDPDDLELTEEEKADAEARMQRVQQLAQTMPAEGGSPPNMMAGPGESTPQAASNSAIHQNAEPTGGF